MDLSPVLEELHFIHELVDQKNAAPVIRVNVLTARAGRNGLGVEARPWIAHDTNDAALFVTYHAALRTTTLFFCFVMPGSRLRRVLQLPSPVEFFDEAPRVAPSRLHLDIQLEKNSGSEHALNLQPCGGSNFLEHLSALSDQDGFLTI